MTATDSQTWTTRALLSWIRQHLERNEVDSPRVAAELLLASVIGGERVHLYMEPERPASVEERARLRELVARAARHEPIQYLLGEAWFYARAFEVGPAVLIPRPATETLVEEAIRWIRACGQTPLRGADVGTGSGCIATTIVAESRPRPRVSDQFEAVRLQRMLGADAVRDAEAVVSPRAAGPAELRIEAIDLSAEALEVARRNAARHGVAEAISFRRGDLLEPLGGEAPLDFVCANLPYISDSEWERVAANVRDHEPTLALRGGRDGLDAIRRLVPQARALLRSGGGIFLEFQFDQAAAVRSLLDHAGFEQIRIVRDHEGLERIAAAVAG